MKNKKRVVLGRVLSKNNISLFLASSSFFVAFITLYFAELKSPEIATYINQEIQVNYSYYGSDISTTLMIPTSYVNTSPKAGLVLESRISIYRKDNPDRRHVFRWRSFAKLTENGWSRDSESTSIAINGKSQQSKVVEYVWFAGNYPNLLFLKGNYIMDMYIRTKNDSKPIKNTVSFTISDEVERTVKVID